MSTDKPQTNPLPAAFYECAVCTDNGSEGNCRPAEEIREAPHGDWLCEYCYDDLAAEEDGQGWPVWADLPKLSEALAVALTPQPDAGLEALTFAYEAGALDVYWEWYRAHAAGEAPPREPDFRKAADDYAASRSRPVGEVKLPRLTQAMIEAACIAHYGKRAVALVGGPGGVDMTARDINYTFEQAFRRMWAGIRAALSDGDAK